MFIQFIRARAQSRALIPFAFVATHNHFVLDRGGKVFKRSAPVIKLPADATEDDHLALLGILNSSTACFWMRQVFQPKTQTSGADEEPDCVRREFTGTGLQSFPLPASRPLDLPRAMQRITDAMAALDPAAVIAAFAADSPAAAAAAGSLQDLLASAKSSWAQARRRQIALQEEIDWQTYSLYGLLDADLTAGQSDAALQNLPEVSLGERPFEIALARRVAAGGPATTWFERHGSKALAEIPAHWPAAYRALIQKRLDAMESNPNVKLIEQPEYKRRWNSESWEDRQAGALREFLLGRLERLFDHDGRMNDAGVATAEFPIALFSIGDLATAARRDRLFLEAAEVLTGDVGFDVAALVGRLVEEESCPLLPQLRYKPTGARKHAEWHLVWELQRKEDALDARAALPKGDPRHLTADEAAQKKRAEVGDIPVPPKYTNADFAKPGYWRLRGKLDVPKERFVALPGIAGPDGTPVYAWAGLDHLELAKAIGDFFGMVQTEYGGSDDPRLVPLLANLSELLPWVQQWHPDSLPDYGGPPAPFYEQFIRDEAAARSLTWADIRAWTPPAATRGKRAAKKAAKRVSKTTLADDGQVDETEEESDA